MGTVISYWDTKKSDPTFISILNITGRRLSTKRGSLQRCKISTHSVKSSEISFRFGLHIVLIGDFTISKGSPQSSDRFNSSYKIPIPSMNIPNSWKNQIIYGHFRIGVRLSML